MASATFSASRAITSWDFTRCWRRARWTLSVARARTARDSPPTPTPGCMAWAAVCVTYCVGGLSLCNSVAGAYAEKSPVVVITGSPGLSERVNNPLLHHRVRDFRTQYDVFEKLCIAGDRAERPADCVPRDRSGAARRGQLQAAGLHRDSARHGVASCPSCRISSTIRRRSAIRRSGRGGERGRALDHQLPSGR